MSDTDQSKKPCGEYHPLPCGLDRACEVPVEFFNAEYDSEEIWSQYMDGDQ